MTKYKIILALFIGTCLASCLGLLLNVKSTILSVVVSMLLVPGSLLALPFSDLRELSSPLGTLAGSAVIYSLLAYIFLTNKLRNASELKLRFVVIRVAALTFILLFLACTPALNPLWPRGMNALEKQEKSLGQALPLGMTLSQARDVLNSRGIVFQQNREESASLVLSGKYGTVTAAAGDQVISSRLQTEASQFPCGYAIDLALVFGPDEALKQKYIHRFPLCP